MQKMLPKSKSIGTPYLIYGFCLSHRQTLVLQVAQMRWNALVIYEKTSLGVDRYTTMDQQKHLSPALSRVQYLVDMPSCQVFYHRSISQLLTPIHLVIYYPSALVLYDKKSIYKPYTSLSFLL
jgi:hypothetical protein